MKANKKFFAGVLAAFICMSAVLTGCSSDNKAETSSTSSAGGDDGVFTIAYAPNESTDQTTG